MNNYRVLRLTSGDEIVCQAVSERPESITVRSPLAIVNVAKVVGDEVEESLSLQRWVHFTETEEVDISKAQVIVNTGASVGLQRFYEYVVAKLDSDEEYSEELEEEEYEEIDIATAPTPTESIH